MTELVQVTVLFQDDGSGRAAVWWDIQSAGLKGHVEWDEEWEQKAAQPLFKQGTRATQEEQKGDHIWAWRPIMEAKIKTWR